MESPWDVRNEIFSNVPGHMTITVYGKTLKKSSFLEPRGRLPWNLVYSIGYLTTTNFFSNDDSGLTLTVFITGSNLFPNASVWVTTYIALSAFVLIQHVLSTQVIECFCYSPALKKWGLHWICPVLTSFCDSVIPSFRNLSNENVMNCYA